MSQYNASLPWSPYETMNSFPSQWDLSSNHSEQQIVNYYNSIFEQQLAHTSHPAAGMSRQSTTSSRGSVSSSAEPQTPRPSETSSRRHTASPRASDSSSSRDERRREQNRASQRAYRDRKDKQLKTLEGQIAQWQAKHQGLCSSYSKQTTEVRKLKAQIEELTSKIITVQTGLLAESPSEFDMVPGYDYDYEWNSMGRT